MASNQVDEGLAASRVWSAGVWRLTGPLKSGGWTIHAGDKQIAVITAVDVSPAEAEANARAMSRASALTAMLEHVESELSGDDDGSRFPDLLKMIREELQQQPFK